MMKWCLDCLTFLKMSQKPDFLTDRHKDWQSAWPSWWLVRWWWLLKLKTYAVVVDDRKCLTGRVVWVCDEEIINDLVKVTPHVSNYFLGLSALMAPPSELTDGKLFVPIVIALLSFARLRIFPIIGWVYPESWVCRSRQSKTNKRLSCHLS